jgi:A/G-specific adenine glycosylase
MTTIDRVRASTVCVHQGRLLCLQLRDPRTRVARLFVPGGAVEPAETPAEAAMRETLEETGYRVRVHGLAHCVRYPFTWNGQEFAVETHFFAAELIDPSAAPDLVDDADYNEGVLWLPLADLPSALGFDETILAAVQSILLHRS